MSDEWQFPPTRWTWVGQSAEPQGETSNQAMAAFCERYWKPLYAFARRSTSHPEDAEDLTQGFFAHLLEKGLLAKADPDRGKLRSYLLIAFKRYMQHQWKKDSAQKRGGDHTHVSWENLEEFNGYEPQASESETPEHAFERSWAVMILSRAQDKLRQEEIARGHEVEFQLLEPSISGVGDDAEDASSKELAAALGVSDVAVRQKIRRLRIRFGEKLREEVAETLNTRDKETIDEEIRILIEALRV
ncbi:MAG: sigma-70 family RNA polymerase sigma factor [Verrucomicrobiales bacterium]|nr:sigma-70 family RNA polymerase sigma factor [Verrucomicrobiales bacterium]